MGGILHSYSGDLMGGIFPGAAVEKPLRQVTFY